MSFWKWSTTASSNDVADTSINLREGMAPSVVNDSARAMMAAMAKYRDDTAGSITTGGTSSAYTVTTGQVLTTLTNGFSITIRPHTTNAASATINVDSLGAKSLRTATGAAIGAGVIIQGTPYRLTYFSAADEWVLHNFYSDQYMIPIGGFMPIISLTLPSSNFVYPYGQAISRTTYATLFALSGTAYGAGDGSTTFNIPDLRGRAIFARDDLGGSAASRLTSAGSGIDGTTSGASGGSQAVTLAQANLPNATLTGTTSSDGAHTHTVSVFIESSGGGAGNQLDNDSGTPATLTTSSSGAHTHTFTTTSINGNVTQTAVNNMPPAIVLPFMLRVI